MTNFSENDARNALSFLAEVAVAREVEISNFNTTRDQESSDEEADSPCPYFDQFYNQSGSEGMKKMTNFTAPEFEQIWRNMQSFIATKYNKGRGMRSKVTGKDITFTLLVVTKHGGQWDILGKLFNKRWNI